MHALVLWHCENSVLMAHIHVTAFPSFSPQLESVTERVAIGSDAVLIPLIPPGRLLAQYYIDWLKNSSSQILGSIQGPRPSSPLGPNPKYSVNPDTFALTIPSVSFDDRGVYFGVVGVVDPAGQLNLYTQTQTLGVTLDVYGERSLNLLSLFHVANWLYQKPFRMIIEV